MSWRAVLVGLTAWGSPASLRMRAMRLLSRSSHRLRILTTSLYHCRMFCQEDLVSFDTQISDPAAPSAPAPTPPRPHREPGCPQPTGQGRHMLRLQQVSVSLSASACSPPGKYLSLSQQVPDESRGRMLPQPRDQPSSMTLSTLSSAFATSLASAARQNSVTPRRK